MSRRNTLVKVLRREVLHLWNDECGSVSAAGGYVLVVVLLSIGMITGLTTFRDQLVQEMGDVSEAVESLDQSYNYVIFDPVSGNPIEMVDFDENNPPAPAQNAGTAPASNESSGGTPPAGINFTPATEE